MMPLKTIQTICFSLCLVLSGLPGANPSMLLKPLIEKNSNERISSWINVLTAFTYNGSAKNKESLSKEDRGDGSKSANSLQPWKADFYKYGYPVEPEAISLEVEFFLGHELLFAGEVRPEAINEKLKDYKTLHEGHKTLELIVLNRNFDSWLVHLDNGSAYHYAEEVSLVFFPGEKMHYRVELEEARGEVRDHHVYYLAISDWSSNLREILEIVDTILNDSEDPYMIYFHGPSNKPIIVDHNSSEDEISNLRSMVTRATHPPGNASEELRSLMNALNDFFDNSDYVPKLKLNLFLSENTHGLLQNGFINPLLNHRIEEMDVRGWQVLFITDFEVPEKNDDYKYEFLSNP